MSDFERQVAKLAGVYDRRIRAVTKTAVKETVKIAQTVTGEGGRMRVKTGFLWHSIAANIGALPAGESTAPKAAEDNSYAYSGGDVLATLIQWDLTQQLYIGWTANYARPREYYDGFVKGATERWQETVNAAAIKGRNRIK
jgi:hypothetical protein